MVDEESYPNLYRPLKRAVRLLLAILRFLIIRPLVMIYFLCCLIASFWVRKDLTPYKVNSMVSLILNLVVKIIKALA